MSLHNLTTFKATVDHRLHETVVDILAPGTRQPVARLAKAGPMIRPGAYVLLTGPGLAEVTAHLTPSGAQHVDGAPIGVINLSGSARTDAAIHPLNGSRHSPVVHNPARWRVVQPGLPVLTGKALGSTRLHHNRIADLQDRPYLDMIPYPVPNLLMLMRFRFSAPDSAGFTVQYRRGRPHIEVTVNEPRLDRRLVFAAITALIATNMWSPGEELTGMLAPFRRKSRDRMPPRRTD